MTDTIIDQIKYVNLLHTRQSEAYDSHYKNVTDMDENENEWN